MITRRTLLGHCTLAWLLGLAELPTVRAIMAERRSKRHKEDEDEEREHKAKSKKKNKEEDEDRRDAQVEWPPSRT